MSVLSKLMRMTPQASIPKDDWMSLGQIAQLTESKAGTHVSENIAMGLPVVYSAIGIIAESLAQLPIDVMRKDGNSNKKQDDHPLEGILNKEYNPYMSAFTGRSTQQSHVLGWGNGFAEIDRSPITGQVRSLWPLLPDRTRSEKDPGKRGEIIFRTTIDGESYDLPYDRVLHVPAWGFDGLMGQSPIRMHRNAIGLALALEEFGSKFFKNDAKSGGFIHYPGKLGEKATDNIESSVNRKSGLDHAHRVRVLEEGAKFVQTTISPEDAQFLLTRTFQVEEVARIYRIPLHMLASHSKDTAWGTGIHEMQIGFLVFTLAPWIIRCEQEINRKLFTPAERDAGFYVKHNVSGLLRGNAKERAEMYKTAKETGWLTVDEIRELEDREPLGGDVSAMGVEDDN